MRSIFLLAYLLIQMLSAASKEAIVDSLATGFIAGSADGHFWAMASSYRAAFDSSGIQLLRHGRRAAIRFPGARLNWEAEGEALAPVHFLGTENRTFGAVSALRARSAYPGVDIVVRLRDGRLKSEFQLAAGVSPSVAGYCWEGAKARGGRDGLSLRIDAGAGWQWMEEGLESWQNLPDGGKAPIRSRFRVVGRCVRFVADNVDPSLPLTIDPELVFSSYMGGGMFDAITAIATDAQGNMYLGGWTESSDFPGLSGYQSATGGRIDGFVAKINAAGQLVFSTYLGGAAEDRVQAIVVDGAGVVTVAGLTNSINFPTHLAARGSLAGGRDAFIARLYPAGNQLVFSTYMGGAGHDAALAVALDFSGNIIAGGETASTDFPVQSAFNAVSGGGVDGFLVRFSPSGSLMSSTYLGGGSDDRIRGIAVSGDGTLHVTGSTASSNFPMVSAAFPSLRGSMDAFYTRFNNQASGSSLSTYLGGSGGSSLNEEGGYGITIDTLGRAWLAGVTPSADFPGVSSGNQSTYGGGTGDAFVSVFTAGGALEWSSFIGGTGLDAATSISAGAGFVGLAGYTISNNFPITGALQTSRAGEYDAFWAAFPIVSTVPLYVSYIGGSGSDSALAVSANGGALAVGGSTLSTNFPLRSSLQSSNPGSYGGFASRLRFGPGPIVVSPVAGSGTSATFTFSISHASGSSTIQNAAFLFNGGFSFSAGCYVYYDRGTNLISLFKDAGAVWLPLIPGSAATVDNGVCRISGTGLTVSNSVNSLIIVLPVSFASSFGGTRKIYADATDAAALGAGWPEIGAWDVVAPSAPAVGGSTPASGSGLSQSFSFTFSDANGAADIVNAAVFFNNVFSTANGCYFTFNQATQSISLFRDSDSAFLPVTPGVNTTVENANCAISGAGASVTAAGTILTITVPVVFKPSFNGPRTMYSSVTDAGGLATAWQSAGTWTPITILAPSISSLLPTVGNGASQAFTISFADGNGYADIVSTTLLINSYADTSNGCYITYNQTLNRLALFRDSDSSFLYLTPGANVVIENPACSINGTSVAISAAGIQLALNMQITLKPAVTGARVIYAAATDAGGLATGLQRVGDWTPFPLHSPTVVAATPSSGGGASQTFTFTFSDANGHADIASASFLVQTSVNTLNACYITYTRTSNTFKLYRDSDSSLLPITPGASMTVENANCFVSGSAMTVAGSGTQLVFSIPISFKTPFAGTKNVYANVTDSEGLVSGWQIVGTWNPYPSYAPSVVSLQPASGAGLSQSFTFRFSDGNGNADVSSVGFLFNTTLNTTNGCYLSYSRSANTLSLYRDSDSSWATLAPGNPSAIENSNCSITGSAFAISGSGNNFDINIPVVFKPRLFGAITVYAVATDQAGLSSGWMPAGTWTVAGAAAPSVTAVSPNSGTATVQTFTATVFDANGHSDISVVQFLVNTSTNQSNGCFVTYNRTANTVSLFRDTDASWLPLNPGSANSVANDFCILSGTGMAVSASGNSLSLSIPIAFKQTFTGAKTVYAGATDSGGLTSGLTAAGSWTLNQTASPTVTSLLPSAGTAASQTFSLVLSDFNGNADISSALLLINGSLNGTNGCFVSYNRSVNAFYLFRDSDSSWQVIYPGTATSVSNANCTINGTTLATASSGLSLTFTLPLTFSASFTGTKTIYVNVADAAGLSSGWITAGSWNPSPPSAPTVQSLSPSSGTGVSQNFTITLADSNGNGDIASALFIVNGAINGQNSCFISYNHSANAFYLYKDTGNVWQLIYPGSSTSVSNPNCSLAGSGLTRTVSGNTVTITLPLSFGSSYSGAKSFYVNVTDTGGLSSGWVAAGTWSTSQAAAPTVTSVSPASGAGPSQLFTVTLADTNGNSDMSSALLLFNGTLNGQNACFISYNRSVNAFYLYRDSDNLWQLIYPGSSSSVTNGNCTITGAALASSSSGNTLTLLVPLSFSSGFTGSKTFYANVGDAGGLSSGWIAAGTWNPSQPVAPMVTSLTPSSGAGSAQTFFLTFSDTNGASDISSALVLINTSINGSNACFISYNRSANAFYLLRDSDSVWQVIYPGSTASVTNNNCTLAGAGLSSSSSGNSLTVAIPLSFKSGISGSKNIYATVADSTGLSSDWIVAGTWLVN